MYSRDYPQLFLAAFWLLGVVVPRDASAQQVDTAAIRTAIRSEIRKDRNMDGVREVDSAGAENTFFNCLVMPAKRPPSCAPTNDTRIFLVSDISVTWSVHGTALVTYYVAGADPYAFMYSESRWTLSRVGSKWTVARTASVTMGDGHVPKDSLP